MDAKSVDAFCATLSNKYGLRFSPPQQFQLGAFVVSDHITPRGLMYRLIVRMTRDSVEIELYDQNRNMVFNDRSQDKVTKRAKDAMNRYFGQ